MDISRRLELKEKLHTLMLNANLTSGEHQYQWLIDHLKIYVGRFHGFSTIPNPEISMDALIAGDLFLMIEVAYDAIGEKVNVLKLDDRKKESWVVFSNLLENIKLTKDRSLVFDLYSHVNKM